MTRGSAAWLMAFSVVAMWSQPFVDAGKYRVTLRLPAEGLSAQAEMQIEYRVIDSTRVDPVMGPIPVIRAKARSVIDMPAMPGMAKLTEDAHPEGVPGEYGVHPVFPHGGEYRMRLFITPPGEPEFQAEFPLTVGDPSVSEKAKARPYYAEIRTTPGRPRAGEPVNLHIDVMARANGGKRVREFDIQHEKPMHLIVVREDLGVFAHEHPALSEDGRFQLRYVFPEAGTYTLFVDAAPRGAGGQVMPVRVKVGGKKTTAFAIANVALQSESTAESVRFTVNRTRFPVGRTLRIGCDVRDAGPKGESVSLEPYLGAMGHLILVHEDGETFVHSHPVDEEPKPGRIEFLARFPKAGRYRGWVQVQRAGRVETGSVIVAAGGE